MPILCGIGCTLNLVVKDGKVVGVEPNQRSPINEGKLCPKGMTCWEHVHSPDRLTTPLIKKDGKFVEASLDEALDLVASKLKETNDTYGPLGFGFQVSCRTSNEDCYIMQKFARVGFKTNNVDNCARICHGPSVAGLSLSFGSGAATNPFEVLHFSYYKSYIETYVVKNWKMSVIFRSFHIYGCSKIVL